jgi:ubiquinone/menaquinone biosynthesis C-methylase UbiE
MSYSSKIKKIDLANRAFFDDWARSYDGFRLTKWFRYTQKLAIQLLTLKPNSKVLDVGCGSGFAVLQLGSILSEGTACGIDISPGMVEKAKRNIPESLHEKVEFFEASSDNIPYPTDEFDHVLCTNSFHHYPNPNKALYEMRRVLKPGGKLLILENAPDRSCYTKAWDIILRVFEKGHIRYYSTKELEALLYQSGFIKIQLDYLQNIFLKHGKLFASIQIWTAQKPFVQGSR